MTENEKPTRQDLEALDVRLKELKEEEFPEVREHLQESRDRLQTAYADPDGGDVETLSRGVAEAEARAGSLGDAIRGLEQKREEMHRDVLRSEAGQRLEEISRSISARRGGLRQRLAGLLEAAGTVQSRIRNLNAAYDEQLSLEHEAKALAKRFGLDLPGLKLMPAPRDQKEVQDVVGRMESLSPARRPSPTLKRPLDPDSPGAKLISEAGPTPEERRKREEEERKRRKQEEEERRLLEPFQPELERAEGAALKRAGIR